MNEPRLLPPALSASDVRLIVRVCDRFEAAWKAGRRPDVGDALGAAAEPVRSALLRQLLLLDWDYRRRAGDDPTAADYRARFPGDTALIEGVGREMAESVPSTRVGSGESDGRHTPGTGAGASDGGADVPPAAETEAAHYDLLGEVGHGGIGVVYRGRDRLLGRELAVKVLRDDHRDRPDARRRFVAEARVGSQLQHPAIVPVYGLGRFADGRPYITMKLVEGHTLADLLTARAGDPAADLPRLLHVFEQVCQAMAYAHARGVIHRDLKPANVMVGAFGEVQVMDWGFAKTLAGDPPAGPAAGTAEARPVTGPVGGTQSGTMMGTPAYMPPEQARGEAALVGPPADVFALGAILCEVLTGQPPYAAATVHEVHRQAAAGDLADAHARLEACGADAALRDLAKRCLAADRAERPADAGVVAADLTGYLASAQERLRQAQLDQAAAEARADEARAKQRAERRALRLALAAAAALLVGAGVATWEAVVATRAKQDALSAAAAQKEAKEAADAARETADARAAESAAMLDFFRKRVFAAAGPEGQDGGLGRDVSLRRAVEAALPFVEKSFATQPLVEARLRLSLAGTFFRLGDGQSAAEQSQRARALFTKHLGPDHPDTLESVNSLATNYSVLGRDAEASRLFEEVLAGRKARLGPDHPDTLSAMSNLAVCYGRLGRHRDALKLQEEALAGRKAKLGPDHPDTLSAMSNLAARLIAFGRYADAAKLGEEVLARRRAELGPEHYDTLDSMNNLAISYAALGRYADAVRLTEQALAVRKVKQGPTHPATLMSMRNLANGYSDLGRHADALKLREETLALLREKFPPDHPETLWGMHNLANSYAKLGRHAEALKLREETLALREAKLGPAHPDTLRSMRMLAESLIQFDRGAAAVAVIDDCVRRSAGKVVHPKLIPGVMDLRLRHFEKANDAAGCRATAEMWEGLNRTDAESLYRAAGCRAVTAKVLGAVDPPPAAAEADRAMAWLTKAVAAGYKDVANMKTDKDLDVLRDRADFRRLMAGLGAGD